MASVDTSAAIARLRKALADAIQGIGMPSMSFVRADDLAAVLDALDRAQTCEAQHAALLAAAREVQAAKADRDRISAVYDAALPQTPPPWDQLRAASVRVASASNALLAAALLPEEPK